MFDEVELARLIKEQRPNAGVHFLRDDKPPFGVTVVVREEIGDRTLIRALTVDDYWLHATVPMDELVAERILRDMDRALAATEEA